MKYFLLLVATCLLMSAAVPYAKILNTNELIAAMQKKYGKSWYKTATFVQETKNFQPDGSSKVETWYEAMAVPGSLRIDFTPTTAGNGILFTDGKIFVFKDGKVETTRPYNHPLLILGFDIYRAPASEVTTKLRRPSSAPLAGGFAGAAGAAATGGGGEATGGVADGGAGVSDGGLGASDIVSPLTPVRYCSKVQGNLGNVLAARIGLSTFLWRRPKNGSLS